MDVLAEFIADFVRARQLNIAVAALLTLGYLVYQYRGLLVKAQDTIDDGDDLLMKNRSSCRMSRSRSRSAHSRSRSRDRRNYDKSRRNKKNHRCANCSHYNCDDVYERGPR
ncbi:uncharacterized protein LOC112045817 [Bicyclus anynana]|uniref:Uncharacterized protein LOC112045817 n=1 Tax=Bicyclus anynana TaxID=110368 RepID=A0ABM3M2I0_BICAN|nr:uncharacterized protein LOC112045817 [Bicyclus anynana]